MLFPIKSLPLTLCTIKFSIFILLDSFISFLRQLLIYSFVRLDMFNMYIIYIFLWYLLQLNKGYASYAISLSLSMRARTFNTNCKYILAITRDLLSNPDWATIYTIVKLIHHMPHAPLLALLPLLLRSVFALGYNRDRRGGIAAATGGTARRLRCRRGERGQVAAKHRCAGMRRRCVQRMCSGSGGGM